MDLKKYNKIVLILCLVLGVLVIGFSLYFENQIDKELESCDNEISIKENSVFKLNKTFDILSNQTLCEVIYYD